MPTSQLLGGYAAVSLESVQSLGGYAYVKAATRQRLYCFARVARTETQALGGYATVYDGVPLGGYAVVRAEAAPTSLGGFARVGPRAGTVSVVPFWPSEGRRFAEEETGYLQVEYRNFPLSEGQADIRWVFDETVLPVNGVAVEWHEPVKESNFKTQGARALSIVEEELDTPRTTRNRQISLDFPPVGTQMVAWFKGRMRIGREFYADFRLFDVTEEDQWEELYTDLSDSIFRYKRYWGSMGYWKPGTVKVRIDGEEITDLSGVGINHLMGFIEFWDAADPASLIEVQYVYTPLMQIVDVVHNPKTGYAFNRFSPKVTMVEIKQNDPAFSLSVGIAPPPRAGYQDSFDRADGNAVQLETGQPWENFSSPGIDPLQISANRAMFDGTGNHLYGVTTDSPDGYLEIAAAINGYSVGSSPALIARYQNANNYLAFVRGGGAFATDFTFQLTKVVAGVGTILWKAGEGQWADGRRLGLLMGGDSITVYIDRVRYAEFAVPELVTGVKHGFDLTNLQRVDDFLFRRPSEIFPQMFPGDPNSDWLTGEVFYDDFNKPDGGGGFLQTGQPWVDGDSAYPMQILSGRCYAALSGALMDGGSAYGSLQCRLYEGQAVGSGQILVMRANVGGSYWFDGRSLWKSVSGVTSLVGGDGTSFNIPTGGSSLFKMVWSRDHYIRCYRDGVLLCTSTTAETNFEDATHHGFSTGNYFNGATDFRFAPL